MLKKDVLSFVLLCCYIIYSEGVSVIPKPVDDGNHDMAFITTLASNNTHLFTYDKPHFYCIDILNGKVKQYDNWVTSMSSIVNSLLDNSY
jgi:hypothetical protein